MWIPQSNFYSFLQNWWSDVFQKMVGPNMGEVCTQTNRCMRHYVIPRYSQLIWKITGQINQCNSERWESISYAKLHPNLNALPVGRWHSQCSLALAKNCTVLHLWGYWTTSLRRKELCSYRSKRVECQKSNYHFIRTVAWRHQRIAPTVPLCPQLKFFYCDIIHGWPRQQVNISSVTISSIWVLCEGLCFASDGRELTKFSNLLSFIIIRHINDHFCVALTTT